MIKSQKYSARSGRILEVFLAFLKLGCTSFGGPIAHLGYFRAEFVERRRWLNDSQFGHLLAICQFLPGPASSQLGFSIGLLRAGWLGGLAAFLAFTLPSAMLLVGFAAALPLLSGPAGQATVHGLKIVACAVVADALLGMSKKLCPDTPRQTIAILSAAALLIFGSAMAQLAVVALAATVGVFLLHSDITSNEKSDLPVPFGIRTGGASYYAVRWTAGCAANADHFRTWIAACRRSILSSRCTGFWRRSCSTAIASGFGRFLRLGFA
jgi:chromate transporter